MRYSRNIFTNRHKRNGVVAPRAEQYLRRSSFHKSAMAVTALLVALAVADSTKSSLATFRIKCRMLQTIFLIQRRELPRPCQQA